MTHVFGAPVDTLATVLMSILLVVLGAVAVLALRNRVFLRLGVRNVRRRPARSALIIAGSMLGTTIIAAALTTGDTMSQTIRSVAVSSLGRTDVVVAAKGVDAALTFGADATQTRYFLEADADRVARALTPGLASAVAPVITEPIAIQDTSSRQNEPRVTLFASDPARMRGFGDIRTVQGAIVTLATLRPAEVYLNSKAAGKLDARAGDTIRMLAGGRTATARVRAIVRYDGAGTSDAGMLVPLAMGQRLLGKPGQIKSIFIVNRHGVGATDRVIHRLQPVLAHLNLEADNTRQDLLKVADQQGAAFMSLFTTFGSFSIAAGVLLIFLIFVMLAAERRGELGIARAIGTRRGHLVQMFLYEGIAYDVLAAMIGALLGVLVAYVMVLVMAGAFDTTSGITISYSVSPTSVVVAYSVGVLLTLGVVAFSAWRVSHMNIVTAIRDLPDPPQLGTRRRRLVPGLVSLALGGLLIWQGVSARDAIVLGFGVILVIVGVVPLARARCT